MLDLEVIKNFPDSIKRVHFIGIGGVGVSAIARMMLAEGKKVSGSDASDSVIIKELKKLASLGGTKVKISIGHKSQNVRHRVSNKIDLVVYTTAIDKNNPELKKAKKLKIPTLTYPEMLGLVSQNKYTIAVSGTHGKTTTTAMIAKVLKKAKFDPTVIVGSILKEGNSNFIAGKSRLVRLKGKSFSGYLVCEACEYRRAFLNLAPKILVITNIDRDHLDYYKNLRDIQSAFRNLASKLNRDDFLICDPNDKNLKPVIKRAKCKIIDYSKVSSKLNLKVPGEYNIENAKAALAVAGVLKVKKSEAVKSLNKFQGTWRRFEYKGKTENGAKVYDDYAHHPTEVKAVLKATRDHLAVSQPSGGSVAKLWVVFQPHLYSRTKILLNDFAKSFNDADEVIITDIYAAREKKDRSISSKDLVEKIKKNNPNTRYIKSFKSIENFLKKNTKKGDIILVIGAGDIFKIGGNIV